MDPDGAGAVDTAVIVGKVTGTAPGRRAAESSRKAVGTLPEMPGFDAEDDDNRPPPHPLDRPWIHPSELGAARVATPSSAPRPRRRRELAIAIGAGAAGAIATVGVLAVLGAFDRDATPARATTAHLPAAAAAAIAARVAPGIAAVSSAAGTAVERRGSGIVVGAHAVLTTTEAVATPAGTSVDVVVPAGRARSAVVRAVDGMAGLVLLDVPGASLTPARLRAPSTLRAGDWVVAVGRTPMNGPWVTSGVITATGGWTTDADGTRHAGLISASTALAEEARGGALVDGQGRIVGILAATATNRAAAMPADVAHDVARQLAARGWASHGALGIRATDSATGPVVVDVSAGSGAAAADVRADDRIVALDGDPTRDTATLVAGLRRRAAGTHVDLTVRRDGRTLHLRARLDDAADGTTTPGAGMSPASLTAGAAGS